MSRSKRFIAASLAALSPTLLLTGCSKLTDREYSYVEDHPQDYIEDSGGQYLTVENYQGLRSAILRYVTDMEPTGAIRISRYNGNIADDVAAACLDISRNDPMGAFCLDYIAQDFSRIVSYYEVSFNFVYNRTPEDVARIVHVYTLEQAQEEIIKAYRNRDTSLILRCYYYDEWDVDLTRYLSSVYYDIPECALLQPGIDTQMYPESGTQRILEFTFDYSEDPDLLRLRSEKLNMLADNFIAENDLDFDAEDEESIVLCLQKLCEALGSLSSYDSTAEERSSVDDSFVKDERFTAFGVLNDRNAVSEGFALAAKLICDRLGIPCQIVQGIRNGFNGCWNMVRIGNYYYHMDACSFASGDPVFLLGDDTMNNCYRWMLANYPMCAVDRELPGEAVEVGPFTEEPPAESEDAPPPEEEIPADEEVLEEVPTEETDE